MKCPVSGAKTCIQDMTVARFYCVGTVSFEIRITAVQNSNVCGVSLKVNVYTKPNPIKVIKSDIKTAVLF